MVTTTKDSETKRDIFLQHFGIGITKSINNRMAEELVKKIQKILDNNQEKREELIQTLTNSLETELTKNRKFVELLTEKLNSRYPGLIANQHPM